MLSAVIFKDLEGASRTVAAVCTSQMVDQHENTRPNLRSGWSRNGKIVCSTVDEKSTQIEELSHQAASADKRGCLWRMPEYLSKSIIAIDFDASRPSRGHVYVFVLPIWAQAAASKHSIICSGFLSGGIYMTTIALVIFPWL